MPPLVLPDREVSGSFEEIARSPAVQLFIERVQAISPEFTLSEQTAPDVAGICRHVDGLPLAIELAAAQISVLPPAALFARIQARLPLPVPGPRDAPVRLRTISDAVAWSYDLLTEEEQQLFRQLSVFTGAFTLDAAEATTSPAALAGIASLVDKNLLQQANRGGESRFLMLETIKSFAHERLVAHDELEMITDAHAAWALALAEPAELATAFPGHEGILQRLEVDHANLLAAMIWLDGQGDGSSLLRLCTSLGQFWITNGRVLEGRFWLERALSRSAGVSGALRGRAQLYLGRILSLIGDVEQADQLMADGIAAIRAEDSPEMVTFALFHRSAVANQLGEYDRAEQILNEAHEIAGTIPDAILAAAATASVLANLGVTAHGRGDLLAARERYEQALSICREHAFTPGMIRALRDLGDLDRDRGELASSVEWYHACLDLLGEEVDLRIVVDALEGTALAAAAWRQPAQAARLLGAAEALRERYGGAFILLTDQDAHDRALAAIRSALSEPDLESAWRSGRSLAVADAIAEARALAPGAHRSRSALQSSVKLSPREMEVLARLGAGYSDRAIAEELFLSVRTIEAHVARILAKFEVRSRAAAVSAALAAGIIEPENSVSPIG